MNVTVLQAVRGVDNFYNFDITGDLDPADEIFFRMASRMDLLTDVDALVVKTRVSGIEDLVAAQGTFQVQLEPADTVNVADEALNFHCIVRKADVGMDTVVALGLVRFSG